jgi:hypothetical protein
LGIGTHVPAGLFLSKGEFGVGRGRVVFLYNLLDLKRTVWEGPELEAGKHTIVFDFKPDGPGLGKGGAGVLSVDGKEVAKNTLEHTTPITFPEDETFDVGQDTRTGVALVEYRYDVPQVHRQDQQADFQARSRIVVGADTRQKGQITNECDLWSDESPPNGTITKVG